MYAMDYDKGGACEKENLKEMVQNGTDQADCSIIEKWPQQSQQ